MAYEDDQDLPLIEHTHQSKFQKSRDKKRKQEELIREELERRRAEDVLRTQENLELRKTIREQQVIIAKSSANDIALTDQVEHLTTKVGLHINTVYEMKTELKRLKKRDESHNSIRDQIIRGWLFSLSLAEGCRG